MHVKLLFTVYIFAFFRMCDSITAEQCPAQDPIYWKALKGYTFKILRGSSPFGCLYHCHYEVRCQSYNYVINNDICEMNNRTQEAKPDQFVSDPDRFYMKRGAHRVALGSTPSLPAKSCQEIKANEAGEAVSGNSWLDPTGSGEVILAHCDMDTEVANFCIRNRCRNGGSCVNGHVNYTCLCDGLWTGTYCEKAIPDTQTISTLASDTQTISTLASDTQTISSLSYDTQTIPTLASDSQTVSTLASDIQTISTLASDTQTVSTTASDTQTISTLVSDTQTISTLASDTQTISTLASDTQTISTLASDTQTISTLASDTQTISTLASDTQTISTLASDTQTISTLASDTQTISSPSYDTQTIPTLASDSQTISTLASDIQTISTLASDTQTVSTMASDTQTISTLVSDTQTISTLASDTQTISTLASDTQTISTLASGTQTTAFPAPTTQSSTAEPGFRVTVVTGTAAGAGTDARLFLQLVGTHGGKSGWTEVATEPGGYKPDFEFGRTDKFTVVFQDVGIISSLEIDLVSTGAWYEGWTVDKFTIEDPGRDMTYTFNGPLNVYPGDDPHVLSAS